MAKYVYPAIFTPESEGGFSINFPDLEGCFTCGDTLEDGLEMAKDALALVLYGYEKDKRPIPTPSDLNSFKLEAKEFVNYVVCDTLVYRKSKRKAMDFSKKGKTIGKTIGFGIIFLNLYT